MNEKNKLNDNDYQAVVEMGVRLFRDGSCKSKVYNEIKKKYKITYEFFKIRVFEDIKAKFVSDAEIYDAVQRELQIQRLENLYSVAMKEKKYNEANKALAELNKILGVAEQKVKVEAEIEYHLQV